MNVANKIKPILTPHYLIIGHYIGKVIGCYCGVNLIIIKE